MPRIICPCAKCHGKYVVERAFNGPDAKRRCEEWVSYVNTSPGLCNDCQLTRESQLAEKSSKEGSKNVESSRKTTTADIEALNLPAITGSSQHQIEQATRLRWRFFSEPSNLLLCKCMKAAPDVLHGCSSEKRMDMLACATKAGWAEDFEGAFAVANARLPANFYYDVLGKRFDAGEHGYIQLIRTLLTESDASAVIHTLLR